MRWPGPRCASDSCPAQTRRTLSPSLDCGGARPGRGDAATVARSRSSCGTHHRSVGRIGPSSAMISASLLNPGQASTRGSRPTHVGLYLCRRKAPCHNSREHPREAATPMTRSTAFAQDNVPRRQHASVTRCCRPQPNGRTRQISPFSEAAHVGALRCTWGRETTCCARYFAVTTVWYCFAARHAISTRFNRCRAATTVVKTRRK